LIKSSLTAARPNLQELRPVGRGHEPGANLLEQAGPGGGCYRVIPRLPEAVAGLCRAEELLHDETRCSFQGMFR